MAVRPLPLQLLPYLWRAWWRKQEKRSAWQGANTGIVILLAVFGLIGVLTSSAFAFKNLRADNPDTGLVLLEFCLNSVLMGWLFIPIMVGSTTAEGRGLQPVRLGQYPLSLGNLLSVGMLGHLVQPAYWILMVSSLCVLAPLSVAPNPAMGLAAGVLYIFFAGWLAWSVEIFGGALFSSRRGREVMMLIMSIVLVPALLIVNGDFKVTEGAITFTFSDHTWLLLSADATTGLFAQMRILSPAVWVSGAASGKGAFPGLALLALALASSISLASLSLRRVMLHPPSSLSGGKGALRTIGQMRGLPTVLGPLVIKELRYLTRTLDHLMGVGMGVAALVWVFVKPDHLPFVLPLAAVNIVINEAAIPLNNFGLDGAGADRYRLLPMTGQQAVLTKNLAYFALVGIHLVPVVLAGLLKGAWWLTLAIILGTAAVTLVTAAGGNMVSISSPARRAFYNFDSKEQAGGSLALFLAMLVWLAPTIVYFGLVWLGMWAVALGMLVLLGGAWLIYRAWLKRAGRAFNDSAETMRERLGKD